MSREGIRWWIERHEGSTKVGWTGRREGLVGWTREKWEQREVRGQTNAHSNTVMSVFSEKKRINIFWKHYNYVSVWNILMVAIIVHSKQIRYCIDLCILSNIVINFHYSVYLSLFRLFIPLQVLINTDKPVRIFTCMVH